MSGDHCLKVEAAQEMTDYQSEALTSEWGKQEVHLMT